MLFGTFELTPVRRPIWAWLELYLTPNRYHLKRHRLDYQPLIKNGSNFDSRDRQKSSLEKEMSAVFLLLFLQAHPQSYLDTLLL